MNTSTDARDRLVAAAQEMFAAQGVGATSPRQVLAASGVGQGSLYHHFPTKHDLAAAAVGATVESALAAARRDLEGTTPALDRVVAYVERPRDALAGCKVGRLTSDQAVMDDDGLRDVVTAYFVRLLDVVATTRVRPACPTTPPATARTPPSRSCRAATCSPAPRATPTRCGPPCAAS